VREEGKKKDLFFLSDAKKWAQKRRGGEWGKKGSYPTKYISLLSRKEGGKGGKKALATLKCFTYTSSEKEGGGRGKKGRGMEDSPHFYAQGKGGRERKRDCCTLVSRLFSR